MTDPRELHNQAIIIDNTGAWRLIDSKSKAGKNRKVRWTLGFAPRLCRRLGASHSRASTQG